MNEPLQSPSGAASLNDATQKTGRRGLIGVSSPLTAFAMAVAGLLITTMAQGAKPFLYDAAGYWTVGLTFTRAGHFSLVNFDSPLRGYLLPLIDRGLHALAELSAVQDSTTAKIFNVVVFSLIATVLLPALAEVAWPQRRWGLGRRVSLAAVLAVMWGGYLAFPLSDFPAVAATLGALVALSRSERIAPMLVAGICGGIAIDMRPAYVALPVAMALILAVSWGRSWRGSPQLYLRRGVCLVAAVVGFVVISLPQSLATHHHGGGWSFVPGSQAHLSNLQYTDGLRLQRYDTYIGKGRAPQMNYLDPSGARLLGNADASIHSTGEYLRIAANHPLTILGVFARHVVNGLDQRYNTPYVERASPNLLLRIIGFTFVFLALLRTAWPAARRSLGEARWRYPVALLVAGITAIVTATETRFLLPAALLSYMVVLAPGWSMPVATLGRGPRAVAIATAAAIIAIAIVFALLTGHVTSEASRNLRFG